MKCLTAFIYRNSLGDCSNHGITAFADRAFVLNLSGPFEPGPNDAKLHIVKGNLPGLLKAVPCDENGVTIPIPSGYNGYMFGGNFIYTSDSRFREFGADYPIPVHDRIEIQSRY